MSWPMAALIDINNCNLHQQRKDTAIVVGRARKGLLHHTSSNKADSPFKQLKNGSSVSVCDQGFGHGASGWFRDPNSTG